MHARDGFIHDPAPHLLRSGEAKLQAGPLRVEPIEIERTNVWLDRRDLLDLHEDVAVFSREVIVLKAAPASRLDLGAAANQGRLAVIGQINGHPELVVTSLKRKPLRHLNELRLLVHERTSCPHNAGPWTLRGDTQKAFHCIEREQIVVI